MLPAAVPVPAYFCPPGAQLPFGAIGYRRLPGQPCGSDTATETTGRELGTLLAALHHVEARKFPAMPGPDKVWQHWHNLRKDTELALPGRMAKSEIQRISRWWDQFLADQRMQHYQPAIRHGDLWYGNLLIQPDGAISAVLDWEVVAIADPAQDLALTSYLGPSCTQTVLDAYRGRGGAYDREIQYRIERRWELRELTGGDVPQRRRLRTCAAGRGWMRSLPSRLPSALGGMPDCYPGTPGDRKWCRPRPRSDPDDLHIGHGVVVRALGHKRNAMGDRRGRDPAVVNRRLSSCGAKPRDQKGPCFGDCLIDAERFEALG